MSDIIKELTDKDDKRAFERTKEIAAASEQSAEYFPYFDVFASLLGDKKSYIRTRAFILCCSQARWDNEGKIRQIMPDMMKLLHDPKPTVVRQCLNAVKELVVFLPELCPEIRKELECINLEQYKDSMTPLLRKDINEVLELINENRSAAL